MKYLFKNLRRSQTLVPIICLCLTALLPILPNLLSNKPVTPSWLTANILPWKNEAAPNNMPWEALKWDGAAQFYVWRDMVWECERNNNVPLWNPHQLCGTPLLANSQSAPLYPIHWLLHSLPTGLAMNLSLLFHLFWAGLGVYWLMSAMQCRRASAFLASATYQYSAFLTAWLFLPSVPTVLSWFGWLLFALHLFIHNPKTTSFAGLTLVIGFMLLAGHLQFVLYGFIICFFWSFYLLIRQPFSVMMKLKILALLGASYIGGFMLASPQLMPSLELASLSHRAVTATQEGYQAYIASALPLEVLLDLVDTNALRNNVINYPEIAMNMGWAALCLAVLSLFNRNKHERIFFLGILLLSWLIAFGTAVNALLYYYLPGFSSTGSPGRAMCLSALCISVLCGIGFDKCADLAANSKLKSAFAENQSLVPIIIILLLAEIAVQAFVSNSYPYAETPYPQTQVTNKLIELTHQSGARIAGVNRSWSLFTVPDAALPPNSAAAYRLYDAAGYDSLIPKTSKNRLDSINGEDSAPLENGNMLFVKNPSAEKLARLGVQALYSPYIVPNSDWIPIGNDIYENTKVPSTIIPLTNFTGKLGSSHVKVRRVSPTRILLEINPPLTQATSATVAETMYPGWVGYDQSELKQKAIGIKSIINIFATNDGLMEINLPEGTTRIELAFEPESFLIGLFAHLVALGVISGLLATSLACKLSAKRQQYATRDSNL